ncbi:MAG: O-antigen ligase family protein [Sedimentisphaerales bacterium]|nr:O-antigen ligase family protein [Sedimentisphaerales bacterium]
MYPSRIAQKFEVILLILCGVIIGVRCQINESFGTGWRVSGPVEGVSIGSAEIPAMMVFSGVIIGVMSAWLIFQAVKGPLRWRKTSLVLPFVFMLAAGILSTWFASNSYRAFIAVIILLAQMILAMLLVQLLDRRWKQKLILCVIAATGITATYRCREEYHFEIPATVDMVEQDVESVLAGQGLEPGTYEAEQFLARVRSRDVGGFFSISNVCASFFVLSIYATLSLLVLGLTNAKTSGDHRPVVWASLALAAQIAGMIITQSKGGIGAMAGAFAVVVILWLGRRIRVRYWRGIIIFGLVLTVMGVAGITGYGLKQGRLPSNSMWIRWQYWHATGKMIAENGMTGVGAENFGSWYPRYMDAAAPEVVSDPHCFWLALWSQWGLLGITGFVIMVISVCITLARPEMEEHTNHQTGPPKKRKESTGGEEPKPTWIQTVAMGLILVTAIVLIRILLSHLNPGSPGESFSVYLIVFILPGLVWLFSFLLLFWPSKEKTGYVKAESGSVTGPLIVLGCGLLGFLIHNSIDFAIFQPGVGTCFFALIATAVAMRRYNRDQGQFIVIRRGIGRLIVVLAALTAGMMLLVKVITPTVKSHQSMQQAQNNALESDATIRQAIEESRIPSPMELQRAMAGMREAADLAQKASQEAITNPEPYYFLGKFYFNWWQLMQRQDNILWDNSVANLKQAIQHDPANYKYYWQLNRLYQAAFEQYPVRDDYLESALHWAREALQMHPTKSEWLIEYAQLLLKENSLSSRTEALRVLEQALDNEQAYLNQQRRMYPERTEILPRLKPDLQRLARQQIETLRQESRQK